jgi:hypothetical protein
VRDSLSGNGVNEYVLDSPWIRSSSPASSLEVYLANAQHVKNVPGGKTDVSDRQWLQYFHSVGRLRASFRLLASFVIFALSGDIAAV